VTPGSNRSPLSDSTIDRHSPLPFYYQLSEILEQTIVGGSSRPGERLPSEPELSERFGLSRSSVRQALARLERRGLITRRKGHGTFVRSAQPGLWLLQSSDGFFQEEVDRLGRTVTSRIVQAQSGPLPLWACDALGLDPGSSGATLERIRSVDGHVALYVINHLIAEVAEVALDTANPNESLYRRLGERAGVEPAGGRRTLEVASVDEMIAGLLDLSLGAPVALIESVTWDTSHRPFDCYRAWLRTDRLKVDIQVVASPASGSLDDLEQLPRLSDPVSDVY
jgi:GntR family transcriptional regulator